CRRECSLLVFSFFFFSSRRRHTRSKRDWSSDVCSSDSPTGLLPLDLGTALGTDGAATTPLILARYARLRAGESLATRFEASGEIYYVIAGSGETTWGAEAIGWDAGDVFCLPGGVTATHRASTRDAVLWIVTNEPELAFERAQAPRPGQAPVEAVHYPGGEIRHQLELIHRLPADKTM